MVEYQHSHPFGHRNLEVLTHVLTQSHVAPAFSGPLSLQTIIEP